MEFFADDTVMFAWYLAAYLPVGLPVLKEAWESIQQKDIFSEFTLMSIATLGAFYIILKGQTYQVVSINELTRQLFDGKFPYMNLMLD